MAIAMDNAIESLKEELDGWLDKYANSPVFTNYLLIIADIMDLLPLDIDRKQAILYILLLQGEILRLERLNRCLNREYNKDMVEEI
ncbi:hypothetical protein [Archaeal virus sp.]|nr:hypothetical protein [Archaeal virus sp.]